MGLYQCPSERNGEGGPVRRLYVPSHVPSHPQTAAKVRGFSPIASGFTAETDWLLEESGFEPSVPLLRKGLPGVAEGRSRNDWLGSRIKLWSSREMAIGCAPSPRPVHGETEISNLVCSGREPELSLPVARDDTGVRNNLPPAARVQLRYQFPTRPAIVNEAAPEIAMPASKRSISRR